ncbi:hypothetical protein GF407_02310 [candidate division KSB1 bacterium]|nr:hypothetical protein [candidate division KSB1 bacterium]
MNEAEYAYFGRSHVIEGDYAIIGARSGTVSGLGGGTAYIFKNNSRVWSEETCRTPPFLPNPIIGKKREKISLFRPKCIYKREHIYN